MKKRFQRKKLFSEKSFHRLVGYARAIDNEVDYLNQQINSLKKFGCNIIFSEILEIGEKNKPELEKAFEHIKPKAVIVYGDINSTLSASLGLGLVTG